MQLLHVVSRKTETPMNSPNDHYQNLPVLRKGKELSPRYSTFSILSSNEREMKEQNLPTPI